MTGRRFPVNDAGTRRSNESIERCRSRNVRVLGVRARRPRLRPRRARSLALRTHTNSHLVSASTMATLSAVAVAPAAHAARVRASFRRASSARTSAFAGAFAKPASTVVASNARRGLRVVANAAPTGDALPPPAVFNTVCATAEKKAAQDPTTTLVLGFSAGALIGIGALLMSCIGAASPALAAANPGLCNFLKGAVGLPAGLTLVILTGAELFTGNVMTMLSGVLTKRVKTEALIRNWVLSYTGNFIGSVVMAYLAFGAATAAAPAAKAAVIGIATTKASLPVRRYTIPLSRWRLARAFARRSSYASLGVPRDRARLDVFTL